MITVKRNSAARNRARTTIICWALLTALALPLAAVDPSIPTEISLADFESGVDPRSWLGNPGGLVTGGPWYAWEQPPSPAGDDINYWEVRSDGDSNNEWVDYVITLAPSQDWFQFSHLNIDYWMWSDGGATNTGIRVYAHDASGTGNSDGNGYQNLGFRRDGGARAFSLANMDRRANVDQILIRVHESYFGGVGKNGARQRTHLYGVSLTRTPEHSGWTWLYETSCLENAAIEVCFDDLFGGAISGIYNKRGGSPGFNFVYPTVGGAFQLALRSDDPIDTCPGKTVGWGQVWNPTQAGCEGCFEQDGRWWSVASESTDRSLTATSHHIDFRPRNYFHHWDGTSQDCAPGLAYTDSGPPQENIQVSQDSALMSDYVEITWSITNNGDHTHYATYENMYRHELPAFFLAGGTHCFHMVHEDENGTLQNAAFDCGSGVGTPAGRFFGDGWYTVYNPSVSGQKLTVIANTTMMDNTLAYGFVRRDRPPYGMQIDLSGYFAIEPGMTFETKIYILPYRWDETMNNGLTPRQFAAQIQAADVGGYVRRDGCYRLRGWASNPTAPYVTDVQSVRVLKNGLVVADKPANLWWDSTVGTHGYSVYHSLAVGDIVEVQAQDPVTQNYKNLIGSPFVVETCP